MARGLKTDKAARIIDRVLSPLNLGVVSSILLFGYVWEKPTVMNDFAVFIVLLSIYALIVSTLARVVKNRDKVHLAALFSTFLALLLLRSIVEMSTEIVLGGLAPLMTVLIAFALRPKWRISAHVGTLASICGALVLIDLVFSPLVLLLPLIVWSKLKLSLHTLDQVVGGGLAGFSASLVAYGLVMIRG